MNQSRPSPRGTRAASRLPAHLSRALAVALAALIPSALAVASCHGGGSAQGASSTGGGTGGMGGMGGMGPTYGAGSCWACVEQACSTEIAACDGDPECTGYLSCLRLCPAGGVDVDPTCEASCTGQATGAGVALQQALTTCRTDGPGAQTCPTCHRASDAGALPDVLSQQCAASSDPNGCTACLASSCCDSEASCANGTPCGAYSQCIHACENGDASISTVGQCILTCADQHSDGVAAFGGRNVCEAYYCATQSKKCAPTNDNPCIDQLLYETCQAQTTKCYLDASCFLLLICTGFPGCDPTQASCVQACDALHPGSPATDMGKALFQDYWTCLNDHNTCAM